jgi:phosphatidylserine decarboxylase
MKKVIENLEKKIWKSYTVNICTKLGKIKTLNVRIAFADLYKINLSEAEKCQDIQDLGTKKGRKICLSRFYDLNDLFYRKRIGITIDKTARIVSPADAALTFYGNPGIIGDIKIKSHKFDINNMLSGNIDGFEKSQIYIFYLSPKDYHRFHIPFACSIKSIDPIVGDYFSVNQKTMKSRKVYDVNKRCIVSFADNASRYKVIIIGATCVGSIVFTVPIGQMLAPGDKFGYFAFGGSTIIVLDKGLVGTDEKYEKNVRVGDKVA